MGYEGENEVNEDYGAILFYLGNHFDFKHILKFFSGLKLRITISIKFLQIDILTM